MKTATSILVFGLLSALATPGQSPGEERFQLWSGPEIPKDPGQLPEPAGLITRTIHSPGEKDHKFLHGAAIVHHNGTLFANWANSPRDENSAAEIVLGRRSKDGGETWSAIEVVAPGAEGVKRNSHGVYLPHRNQLWFFCARFGPGPEARGKGPDKAKRFSELQAEAFVLNGKTDKWESRGMVMDNCWPYDEPVRMDDGNWITGGQDKNGLPVVAISQGDDFAKEWHSVLIPFDPALKPSHAETTVWAEGKQVIAVIRGGSDVAWVSISNDHGKTWERARASNYSMPRSKAYLGKLSTGQLYLVANLRNRDSMVVAVGKPGEMTLSAMWRIRHGSSKPVPRFEGAAKSPQWSYPYAHEHDGKLHILYSIGKEDCGLSVLPVKALATE